MNEKIRELALQARDLEDFGELILKDVVSQVALIAVSNWENEEFCWCLNHIIDLLETRYGIKNDQQF